MQNGSIDSINKVVANKERKGTTSFAVSVFFFPPMPPSLTPSPLPVCVVSPSTGGSLDVHCCSKRQNPAVELLGGSGEEENRTARRVAVSRSGVRMCIHTQRTCPIGDSNLQGESCVGEGTWNYCTTRGVLCTWGGSLAAM